MDTRLSDYVRGQWPTLVRYAALLCGDAGEAEELVQSTLTRVAVDPAGGVVYANSQAP